MERPDIDADLKVARLLDHYPELEGPLVELAPEFRKLKNPVLRKTIAKITSLRQAATIAGIPAMDLVNRLRVIAGLAPQEHSAEHQQELMGPRPEWAGDPKPLQKFDATEIIQTGGMPLNQIMDDLEKLPPGGIYLLITPLLPAPLLEKARKKGFITWTQQLEPAVFYSYIIRLS